MPEQDARHPRQAALHALYFRLTPLIESHSYLGVTSFNLEDDYDRGTQGRQRAACRHRRFAVPHRVRRLSG